MRKQNYTLQTCEKTQGLWVVGFFYFASLAERDRKQNLRLWGFLRANPVQNSIILTPTPRSISPTHKSHISNVLNIQNHFLKVVSVHSFPVLL